MFFSILILYPLSSTQLPDPHSTITKNRSVSFSCLKLETLITTNNSLYLYHSISICLLKTFKKSGIKIIIQVFIFSLFLLLKVMHCLSSYFGKTVRIYRLGQFLLLVRLVMIVSREMSMKYYHRKGRSGNLFLSCAILY